MLGSQIDVILLGLGVKLYNHIHVLLTVIHRVILRYEKNWFLGKEFIFSWIYNLYYWNQLYSWLVFLTTDGHLCIFLSLSFLVLETIRYIQIKMIIKKILCIWKQFSSHGFFSIDNKSNIISVSEVNIW